MELLKQLDFAQLQQLRDKMIRKSYKHGERVINEGDPGSAFYVITQGYATVSRKREAKFVGGVRTENPEEDEIGVSSRVTYITCMSIRARSG